MRAIAASALGGVFLLFTASSAVAQVQVDVRLEKTRYLVGEPVVVVVEVRNIGDEPVGYSTCDGNVQLAVPAVTRREPPNIFGCHILTGRGAGACAVDHPPMLPKGQTTTFRYVLKEYDLARGQYELTASGKAGVRWKYYPDYRPNAPPPKHKESDPVPGALFERTLPLNIVAATGDELRAAFGPLVSDAGAPDLERRRHARDAIIESAPSFLESLIASFTTDDDIAGAAVDALGRLGTPNGRTLLKNLYRDSRESLRSWIVLVLARIGNRADEDFFNGVLRDSGADQSSRRYAALAFGYIGGDQAVQHLERALPIVAAADASSLPWVATALGNTRSRAAVPILIGMWGPDATRDEICGALRTLTHQHWCDGTAIDSAAKRRQWLRRWNETGANAEIFGPDNCPADPVVAEIVPPAAPAVERAAPPGPPRISALSSAVAAPKTVVVVAGYALGLEDHNSVRILFMQGAVQRTGAVNGSTRGGDGGLQYMDVVVPAELTPGRWHLVVDANGRRSAPVSVEITGAPEMALTNISPPRPHPAQGVFLSVKTPAQVDDYVQLTDARGAQWRISAGVSSLGINLMLPDEVADGEASVRLGRSQNGVERFSAPLRFLITSGPLPLKTLAVEWMTPVAPGQWTDLGKDHEIEFELSRADRVEVEFRQENLALISQTSGRGRVHVQVPGRLSPGLVSVRTRTWIEQTASDWSAPATSLVLERPAPPWVTAIESGQVRGVTWWVGKAPPAFVESRPGQALVLRGHFPVAGAADLRVQLIGTRQTLDLPATDVEGGVRVELPAQMAPGDWRLIVGTRDATTSPQEVTTVRLR